MDAQTMNENSSQEGNQPKSFYFLKLQLFFTPGCLDD